MYALALNIVVGASPGGALPQGATWRLQRELGLAGLGEGRLRAALFDREAHLDALDCLSEAWTASLAPPADLADAASRTFATCSVSV